MVDTIWSSFVIIPITAFGKRRSNHNFLKVCRGLGFLKPDGYYFAGGKSDCQATLRDVLLIVIDTCLFVFQESIINVMEFEFVHGV